VVCFGTSSNQCITCSNSTYTLNSTCYTNCPAGYLNNLTSRTCASCPPNCVACPTSTLVCSSCQPTYFIFAYNSSYTVCLQSCPSLYYQIGQTCYACQPPCLACTALYTCINCTACHYLINGSCYPC
jgi:proprotein convertase subtilisin/kexin type 5